MAHALATAALYAVSAGGESLGGIKNATGGDGSVFLSTAFTDWYIPLCALSGLLFALAQLGGVSGVRVANVAFDLDTESGALLGPEGQNDDIARSAAQIHGAIREGARAFLKTQYTSISYFMAGFATLVFFLLGSGDRFRSAWSEDDAGVLHAPKLAHGAFTTISFLVGAGTSLLSGFLGMSIGTFSNVRVAIEARRGMMQAFTAAFRSGSVMGFTISSLALASLYAVIQALALYFQDDWPALFVCVAGYGLGGSSVALFGRVGGGLFTKAADVGADLVGKVERGIPEDDPRNPAVIADLVGDLVGDIAGMGADLFGSYAEASVSALVLASVSSLGESHNWSALMFPLTLSATSLLVCMFVTLLATDVAPARSIRQVGPVIKSQLIISAMLMALVMLPVTLGALPSSFSGVFVFDAQRECSNWAVYVCVVAGVASGLVTGLYTEYMTSNSFRPVQEVAESCRTGTATSIIFGLALGYKSVVIPVLCLATTIFVSYELAGFYGVAVAALGVLGNLATALSIDAFGPIADNAGGIAEMSGMGEDVRERTDALDAAGNTTAAIGKGFAIGSAALVSLALFGSYISQSELQLSDASLLDSKTYVGLLVGAMLPYAFSAMTLKGVGNAALSLVDEVRTQFRTIPGLMQGSARPDYQRCITICTKAALTEMIAPGALVILSPITVGVLFGTRCLAGLLTGALTSGVQMAISASCSGSAWDNAKKYLEAGACDHARSIGGKGTEAHKSAVISDTVGDPLKDTSGPSLNVLVKLSAITALILAPFFREYTAGGLIFEWLH